MQRIFLAGLLLLCTSGAARAETYYIASDGSAENDGSRDKPWPSVNSPWTRLEADTPSCFGRGSTGVRSTS